MPRAQARGRGDAGVREALRRAFEADWGLAWARLVAAVGGNEDKAVVRAARRCKKVLRNHRRRLPPAYAGLRKALSRSPNDLTAVSLRAAVRAQLDRARAARGGRKRCEDNEE
jgi:hypothetical protein